MDSDCLVKLTKAGIKEAVVSAMEVYIPYLVKKETVDDVVNKNYQDAGIIKENIGRNVLHVARHVKKGSIIVPAAKGEEEVVSLYLRGDFDAVASDDRKFLKKLDTAGIPYLTPAVCVVYLYKVMDIKKSEALAMIERLRPFISKDEYVISKFYMEEIR
ncbi:MAG: hypothetical protein M1353_00920 [Nitrospirae bacterium]|nr:hypothetical protein [Nitrospirota bacterium]